MKSSVTTNDEQQLQSFSTESLTARKIVDEILHFGVSQTQLIIIIKLLALELEDLQLMKKIASLVNESDDNVSNDTQQKSKILL
jgi:hypothetical protein